MANTLTRFHARRWTAVTWIAVVLWATYGLVRNLPTSEIAGISIETRTLHPQFEAEVSRIAKEYRFPSGWPLFSVRPINGFSWDTNFAPLPNASGSLPPAGPRADFFPLVLVANFAIAGFAILAIIYICQSRFEQFSIRHLLLLTAATAGCCGIWRLVDMLPFGNAINSFVTTVYLAPIAVLLVGWFMTRGETTEQPIAGEIATGRLGQDESFSRSP